MKTLIVGTGVIGILYGWALDRAGVEIVHLVRSGGRTPPGGVRLDVLDERKGYPKYSASSYPLRRVDAIFPADGYDLVLIPVNAHQVESALRQLAPAAGEATLLIFSGIWDGADAFDEIVPRERCLFGYPDGGGTVRNGIYWTNLGPEVHLGLAEGQSARRLEQAAALFARADIRAEVHADMIHWLWMHIAGFVGFSAGLAKHRDSEAYLRDGATVRKSIRATRELYALCRRRGVGPRSYPETAMFCLPDRVIEILFRWNLRRNESMQRYTAHAASAGSLREARGYFDGIMNTAEELGLRMPVLRGLGGHLPDPV
jgi:2-dehydropantoate 2-reductase